jgi:predicted Fe-Mo cluster-binding NifX family protein
MRPTILAIPEWEGRVSPLFDVAGTLLIVHLSAQGIVSCQRRALVSQDPVHRAMTLVTWHIQKVLCGGISRDCQEALESAGVTVIPHLSGCIQGVLRAYLHHQLADQRFSMPGCRARCPCCRARRYHP